MPHLATRLARQRRRPTAKKPFNPAPSSLVMASVASLAVIWAVTLSLEDPLRVVEPPPVDLPLIATQPVDWSEDHLLVSVTTDDLLATGEKARTLYSTQARECRVFIDDRLVSSEELYDQAFTRLDNIIQVHPGGAEEILAHPIVIPTAFVRADRNTPWRCVAGAIYNIEAAGYAKVRFLTRPVA